MIFERKRVFITVKTYPTISEKYAELVCTAGVLEDGSWIRIYPMPFRSLNDDQKYPKYTWINVEVEKNTSDFRPESFRPNLTTIEVEPKPKQIDWEDRRSIIFKNKKVFSNLQELIDSSRVKANPISLALFKPTKILDFVIESDKPEWDPIKLKCLQEHSQQLNLFKTIEELEKEFRVVKKIPYRFSYRFEDDSGKSSKLMIEDWEIGMLYLNCLKRANGNAIEALAKVKEKYFDYYVKKDLYFFLGTTLVNHFVSRNPFIIIGLFCPPFIESSRELSLFD